MIKCGIYIIKNIKNNKFYLGSSKNIPKRWRQHISGLNNNKHHNIYLQRAWNKYGENNFMLEAIKRCASKNLIKYEQEFLDKYMKMGILYNISPTSSGGDILSSHPNRDEIIKNIKKSLNDIIANLTYEEKQKRWAKYGEDNPNYKNEWSQKNKDAASKRMKEYFSSQEARDNISNARKKYFSDPENRAKMSAFASTRTGDKNSFYGKHHSEETKEKMSKIRTGKYVGSQERKVEIDGILYKSVSEAARQIGVCPATIIHRIKSPNKKFVGYKYSEDKHQ